MKPSLRHGEGAEPRRGRQLSKAPIATAREAGFAEMLLDASGRTIEGPRLARHLVFTRKVL